MDSSLPLASRYLIAVSQIAEHLLQQVSEGSHTEEWSKLGSSCLSLLNLDEAALSELCEEAAVVLGAMD